MEAKPLISCIMPTYNRRQFIPHAIAYFLRQDYENKELVIIDDGSDSIQDLVPQHPSIHYYRLENKITLGAKLNLACEYVQGDLIANWDDDDWYAANRLSYQVGCLKNSKADVCGINTLLYFDIKNKKAFKYIYPSNQRVWLLGSSLCFKKELWGRNKFAEINVGMDGLFVWATPPEKVKVLENFEFSVHTIHEHNISPKNTNGGWWHPYPVVDLEALIKDDWHVYSNGNLYESRTARDVKTLAEINIQKIPISEAAIPPVQNVFACLVHENEECIIDLVRNLSYHDPGSIILLYNGGSNTTLFKNTLFYEKFNVRFCPDPHPLKYGYLHNFAIECMQFAIQNFAFDTFTIVDSDQLLVQSGYSNYLSTFLHEHPGVGLLSSEPQIFNFDNKTNYVVAQAFKEYDLWKPLLQQFYNGENSFVHWTFWPSTVFTKKAIADLIKIFQENELLQSIMRKTNIWATEEVILPTLVSLLGHKIALTPCSFDFVKYKNSFTLPEIEMAMSKRDVYWVHPVERKYENPVRNYSRQRFNHYFSPCIKHFSAKKSSDMLLISSVINRVKKIEGWLSEPEIELLMAAAIQTCVELPAPQYIIEIGSYQGKSTVALGNVVKSLFPMAKIIAIDPHDGVVSGSDESLHTLPSSLQSFKRNLDAEGLTQVVELIQDFSFNVKWEKPVHMIFIDGLHDYPNVSRDFWNFSEKIVPNGYIAFHDYADYYPGVKAFVNELLQTESYQKIAQAESLIVLKKSNTNSAV